MTERSSWVRSITRLPVWRNVRSLRIDRTVKRGRERLVYETRAPHRDYEELARVLDVAARLLEEFQD